MRGEGGCKEAISLSSLMFFIINERHIYVRVPDKAIPSSRVINADERAFVGALCPVIHAQEMISPGHRSSLITAIYCGFVQFIIWCRKVIARKLVILLIMACGVWCVGEGG